MSGDFRDLQKLTIEQNAEFLSRFPKVMVACSGGVDSIVLFDVLCALKKSRKISELAICHVNFHLRGDESEADEAFIANLCQIANIDFFVKRVAPAESESHPGESTQEWARRIRYEFFASLAANDWTIALAHHKDDLVENIILRLARGSSAGSLTGMSPLHRCFWRPFLGVRKTDLIAWAARQNLPHREDASNAKMDYSRNVIRHKILPELEQLFPGAIERIARTGNEIVDLERYCTEKISEDLAAQKPKRADLRKFEHYGDGVLKTAIVRIIGHLETGFRKFESGFLDQAVAFARSKAATAALMVPGGGVLQFRHGLIEFLPVVKSAPQAKHQATRLQYTRSFIIGPRSRIDFAAPDGTPGSSLTILNSGLSTRRIDIARTCKGTERFFQKSKKYFNISRLMDNLDPDEKTGKTWLTVGDAHLKDSHGSEKCSVSDMLHDNLSPLSAPNRLLTVKFSRNRSGFSSDSK